MTPAVTFAAYAIAQSVSQSHQFSVTTAFTSLSLLSIMINPIAELVTAATNLSSALSCLERIQTFLEQPTLEIGSNLEDSIPGDSDKEKNTTAATPLFRLTDLKLGYKTPESQEQQSRMVLSNINKTILQGTFTIITGPVGSGKTTFLRALLGEVDVLQGTFQTIKLRQIAFCDQTPWILNTSVRENVLAVSDYNADRYSKVVEACQLQYDFDEWTNGDQTQAGSNGLTLSGGQRARIVSNRNP